MRKHSGPTALKLNGKPFTVGGPSPSSLKVKAFLESLPQDELLTGREVAKRTGMSQGRVKLVGCDWPELKHKVLHTNFYGSPKAIAELRRQLEAQS